MTATIPPFVRRSLVAGAHERRRDAAGRLLVVTDRVQAGARGVPAVVASAVAGGARWILLRDRDLPGARRTALRHELEAIVGDAGGVLSVAGAGGDAPARHLAASEPFPVPRPRLVGRSCHSPDDLRRASDEGCDYAVISPVFETGSKPGYGPALGLGPLPAWCGSVALPVYALGGIDPARARSCIEAGAAGVAVMGAVMRAAHPDRVVTDLLERIGGAL